MCQGIQCRRQLAVIVTAILVCAPLLIPAQDRVRVAENAPVPDQLPSAAPQISPTPEELGDAYLAHQRYQEAIGAYKEEARPSAAVWNKMGIAYELMFDSRDAIRCYKESLHLDHRNAQVINNLGTVFDSQKRYKPAERMYRKAIRLDSTSAIIFKNLGTNQLARHKYQQGWAAYSKALALDPHIFDQPPSSTVQNTASLQERGAMNYYMAKSCVQAGLTDRAIQFLRLALSEGFTSPKKVAEDSSFAKLRGNPAFQELLAEQH